MSDLLDFILFDILFINQYKLFRQVLWCMKVIKLIIYLQFKVLEMMKYVTVN